MNAAQIKTIRINELTRQVLDAAKSQGIEVNPKLAKQACESAYSSTSPDNFTDAIAFYKAYVVENNRQGLKIHTSVSDVVAHLRTVLGLS